MSSRELAFGYHPSVEVSEGLWYCADRELWWKDGTLYDELSAQHNGLVGEGALLRKIIQQDREVKE